MAATAASHDDRAHCRGGVDLPAVHVLRKAHVESALSRVGDVDDDGTAVTLWINSCTVGIESGAFCYNKRVGRVVVRAHELGGASTVMPSLEDIRKKVASGGGDAREVASWVGRVGDRAFYGCTRLTHVSLPDSITHLDGGAFAECPAITDLVLPKSLEHIGNIAFYGCAGLTTLLLPNTLVDIGNCAFWGCTGLRNLMLPDSLTHIGTSAFDGCSGLSEDELVAIASLQSDASSPTPWE